MTEKLIFHFTGALAEQHRMNFYEASRFQYAAARLMVKLAQFRDTGRFARNITNKSNYNIQIRPFSEGSFDITLALPDQTEDQNEFIDIQLTTLFSWVVERLISRTSDDELISMMNAHPIIVERFGSLSVDDEAGLRESLIAILREPDLRQRIAKQNVELMLQRISELARAERLSGRARQLAKIDASREQRLISMSAPLVAEMATALRRSADGLQVISKKRGRLSQLLFLNKRLADEIEATRVDRDITPIIGNIIQYNKETGWGKVRLEIADTPLSFTVPSDLKNGFRSKLLAFMVEDEVYLQCRIVRDKTGEAIRIIIVDLLPMPD